MGTALITGATAGLGHEFARQLAERGHGVVLVARDEERLESVAAELSERYAVTAEVLPADLTDRSALQRVADRVADGDRPVDLLVNNAGLALRKRFTRNDMATEEAAFDLMCRAVLVLSHAAALAMEGRGHGAIVNVSSIAGFMASGTYAAEKAFVTVFSEGLSTELAGTGVTVTALCPGFTRTEFHQRAGMDTSQLPSFAWLDAADVVRQGLADVAAGKPISVPSLRYKIASLAMRILPRPIVRGSAFTPRHRR